MTKQEQIEEMAKNYCKNGFFCSKFCQTDGCRTYETCETLYNAGYRKIDNDCAVITKAELKQYKVQAVKEFAERFKNGLSNCSGCYIPDCFERATDEFAYSEKDLLKLIYELLKEYEK